MVKSKNKVSQEKIAVGGNHQGNQTETETFVDGHLRKVNIQLGL